MDGSSLDFGKDGNECCNQCSPGKVNMTVMIGSAACRGCGRCSCSGQGTHSLVETHMPTCVPQRTRTGKESRSARERSLEWELFLQRGWRIPVVHQLVSPGLVTPCNAPSLVGTRKLLFCVAHDDHIRCTPCISKVPFRVICWALDFPGPGRDIFSRNSSTGPLKLTRMADALLR